MVSTATYLILCFRGRIGKEGRLTNQHLVQYDPHAPPITELGVSLAEQDLRRYVVGRADQGVGETALVFPLPAAL
jgi:hypothetical protein